MLEDVRLERRIVVGVDDAPPPAPAPTMLLSLSLVNVEGELDVRLDVGVGEDVLVEGDLSLIHISEPTRRLMASRMPSSA